MIELLPFVLLGGAYLLTAVCHAGCLRVSARLLFDSVLGWRRAFTFAVIIAAVLFVGQASSATVGVAAPQVVRLVFGLLVNLGIGGWYFRTPVATLDGRLLGWRGGMLLALAAFAFLLLIEQALSWGAAHLLGIATQP